MGKRAFDVLTSALALLLLAPVVLVVAGAVTLALGRPVLFTQVRPGLHARPFTILKFRTMLPPTPGTTGLGDDERRLTRFGRALRASSLDELPELWNVLRGDMSLVGPRPLLMEYLEEYSSEQFRRHDVRPGITGLAQVSGRNSLDWPAKLALDVEYVDRRSWHLDACILLRTVLIVVSRRGISAEGHATAPLFTAAREAGRRT